MESVGLGMKQRMYTNQKQLLNFRTATSRLLDVAVGTVLHWPRDNVSQNESWTVLDGRGLVRCLWKQNFAHFCVE